VALTQEMAGRVLVVTLDRPRARNALDAATMTELRELFEALATQEPLPPDPAGRAREAGVGPERPRPHAVLLRSRGDVFCAGADLGDMKRLGAAGFDENLAAAREMGAMFRAIRACPAPVVVRVQGAAFGGGVGLAAACDIVVASQEARFCFTEVRLGLVPGVIAPIVLQRMTPAAARAAFLTAESIRAVDAYRLGLVDRLADDHRLDDAVARTVMAVLAGGPAALGRAKALVDGSVSLGYDRSVDFTAQSIAEARTGAEAQAALQAFFERASAPWKQDEPWSPGDGG
jgi:methylglutaconyl-CoA hydratase